MALKAPTTFVDKNPQANLEPGTYPARIVRILDMGLQPQRPYKGEDKPPAHIINVTYELVDVFMTDDEGEEIGDKPRWISEEFPLHSLKSELAKSTKRYNAIDPEGKSGGDWSQLLGAACMVTTAQSESAKTDKVYDNVSNVTRARASDMARMPELQNPSVFFDLSAPDLEVFGKLPQWQQDKIKQNLEYAGSPLERLLTGSKPAKDTKAKVKKEVPVADDSDEDAPW